MTNLSYFNAFFNQIQMRYQNTQFLLKIESLTPRPENASIIKAVTAAAFTAFAAFKFSGTAFCWPVVIVGVAFAGWTIYAYIHSNGSLTQALNKILKNNKNPTSGCNAQLNYQTPLDTVSHGRKTPEEFYPRYNPEDLKNQSQVELTASNAPLISTCGGKKTKSVFVPFYIGVEWICSFSSSFFDVDSDNLTEKIANKLNQAISEKSLVQVGEKKEEFGKIIAQHSWYKAYFAAIQVEVKVDPDKIKEKKSEGCVSTLVNAGSQSYPILSNIKVEPSDIVGMQIGGFSSRKLIGNKPLNINKSNADHGDFKTRGCGIYFNHYQDKEGADQLECVLVDSNLNVEKLDVNFLSSQFLDALDKINKSPNNETQKQKKTNLEELVKKAWRRKIEIAMLNPQCMVLKNLEAQLNTAQSLNEETIPIFEQALNIVEQIESHSKEIYNDLTNKWKNRIYLVGAKISERSNDIENCIEIYRNYKTDGKNEVAFILANMLLGWDFSKKSISIQEKHKLILTLLEESGLDDTYQLKPRLLQAIKENAETIPISLNVENLTSEIISPHLLKNDQVLDLLQKVLS